MDQATIGALSNLFAIFSAKTESTSAEALSNFNKYLERQWGIATDSEHSDLFAMNLSLYLPEDEELDLGIDIDEQLEIVSSNIASSLHKNDQVIVFLRFLELAKNGDISKAQVLFDKLSIAFDIMEVELTKLKAFVFQNNNEVISSPDFIHIGQSQGRFPNAHFLKRNHLKGDLLIMNSNIIDHLLLIYQGDGELKLEGNIIKSEQFYALKEGGIIRYTNASSPIYFSDIEAKIRNKKDAPPFTFCGQNLDFRFKNSDNGLHDFSFEEKSGQLIAVMGGSGVGKSTLFTILNGTTPPHSGKLTINGKDVYLQPKEVEGLIGFVPQDDLLFEDLTVWQNLYYNACLCFDNMDDAEIRQRVDTLLLQLELDQYSNLKVGSPLKKTISGGQRKRLNVALELIREPSILFVDEPTSGLSSNDSEKVMLLLKQQASHGRLVFVNIHQPSSSIFKLFNQLWILDKGGRPIYTGNPLDGIIHFREKTGHVNAEDCECPSCGNVNPEQVLEIIETKVMDSSGYFTSERRYSPQHWYGVFKSQIEQKVENIKSATLPLCEFKKPSIGKQFMIFFERNIRSKLSDQQYLLVSLLEAPVLALIVAFFTRYSETGDYTLMDNKSIIPYLFMSIVVVLFMSMSMSAEEIVKDRKILQRESFLNLSRWSYINSKMVFLLLLSAIQTLSFVLVGNLVLGIHGHFFSFWLILFSTAVFSNIIGLHISSTFDSVVTIYILIPLLLIPQILLCGVIIKFDDLQDKKADKDAVPIIGEMMVSRWAFEAMAVDMYVDNEYMLYFFEEEKAIGNAKFKSDILCSKLMGQSDLATSWIRSGKPQDEINHKLKALQNELIKLNKEPNTTPYPSIDAICPENYTPAIAQSLKHHLEELKEYYKQEGQAQRKSKDRTIRAINEVFGSEYLYETKQKYHNTALENLVLNTKTKHYLRETENGYMQKVAPIYKTPDYHNGRAHFLSAEKQIGQLSIPTPIFNIIFIWLVCIVLYIGLYYDVMRKSLAVMEKLKNKRP